MLGNQDFKFLTDYLPFISHLDQADLELITSTCSKSAYAPGEIILNRE